MYRLHLIIILNKNFILKLKSITENIIILKWTYYIYINCQEILSFLLLVPTLLTKQHSRCI